MARAPRGRVFWKVSPPGQTARGGNGSARGAGLVPPLRSAAATPGAAPGAGGGGPGNKAEKRGGRRGLGTEPARGAAAAAGAARPERPGPGTAPGRDPGSPSAAARPAAAYLGCTAGHCARAAPPATRRPRRAPTAGTRGGARGESEKLPGSLDRRRARAGSRRGHRCPSPCAQRLWRPERPHLPPGPLGPPPSPPRRPALPSPALPSPRANPPPRPPSRAPTPPPALGGPALLPAAPTAASCAFFGTSQLMETKNSTSAEEAPTRSWALCLPSCMRCVNRIQSLPQRAYSGDFPRVPPRTEAGGI